MLKPFLKKNSRGVIYPIAGLIKIFIYFSNALVWKLIYNKNIMGQAGMLRIKFLILFASFVEYKALFF